MRVGQIYSIQGEVVKRGDGIFSKFRVELAKRRELKNQWGLDPGCRADFDISSQGVGGLARGWIFFAADAAHSAPCSRQAIADCRTFLKFIFLICTLKIRINLHS